MPGIFVFKSVKNQHVSFLFFPALFRPSVQQTNLNCDTYSLEPL